MSVEHIARELRLSQGEYLNRRDATLMRLWGELWAEIEAELTTELDRIFDNRRLGNLPAWELAKSRRIALAIQKAETEVRALLAKYDAEIIDGLREKVLDTLAAHEQMLTAQLPNAPSLGLNFVGVNDEAITGIVTRATGRIESAHLVLPTAVSDVMKRNLIRGTALGENPRKVARRIIKQTRRDFNGGLARATMIARTEMLDATREAAQAYEQANSDVLEGWVWVCAFDARTCPACISHHGRVHPLDEPGPLDHHNGRCARVPLTKTWEQLGIKGQPDTRAVFTSGEDWYRQQTVETQKSIMGKTRWQKLEAGEIAFEDLYYRKKTKGWRDAYHVTPVKDL